MENNIKKFSMASEHGENMKKKLAPSYNKMINLLNNDTSYLLPKDLTLALELEEDDGKLTDSAKEYKKILSRLKQLKNNDPKYYWFLMKLVLYLECYQFMLDMYQCNLYNQKIIPSMYKRNNFVIYVPGLSEDRPSIKERDDIVINQVNGDNDTTGKVTFVGAKYVTVSVAMSFINRFHLDQRFNIRFQFSDYCYGCCHAAVNSALQCKLLPILFPTDIPKREILQRPAPIWINPNIKDNPEQQQAVIHILTRSAFPAPYILFGPPGTGKTSTLVEAIAQILMKNPSNRILVCTPSNAAADEIALRLLKTAVQAHEIHRIYSCSRGWNEITDDLKSTSNFVEKVHVNVEKEVLMAKKVIITTLMTCNRLKSYRLRENHFSYVFVDEAGQATEAETLIPITLMTSARLSHIGRIHGQLVLSGDPKQLGPMIRSKLAENLLGCSMLERLIEWGLYRKDENNKFNPSYITKLVQNYRSHPAILHIPNVLFYDGELKSLGGSHTKRATNWSKLPSPNFPIIFHAVDGKEERDSNSPSVYNREEIKTVISYVNDLLNSTLGDKAVRQEEIGIVTPYRLQRHKIHETLEQKGWKDVTVGTVETFQGQERDIIIISTVRSLVCKHNGQFHIGFLSHPKRFNVSLTRAKALLIVVGNPMVLQIDEYWREFIRYCIDNGACRGPKFLLERSQSRAKMSQRLVQKWTSAPTWNPDMPLPVVEEVPKDSIVFQEKSFERRRRLPRYYQNSETRSRPTYVYAPEIDYESDDEYFECLDYNEDLELQENLSEENISQTSDSPSDASEKRKESDNSWETASTSTTTDQSEKCRLSDISTFLSNLMISNKRANC